MNCIRSKLTAFFLLIPLISYSASIDLVEELTFTVPMLNGQIFHITFDDIDGDNIPEVLACDSTKWVLYSISNDSIIAFDSLHFPPDMRNPYANNSNVRILLDDIDNDALYDVVICVFRTEYGYYTTHPPIELRVYSGASRYQNSSSYFVDYVHCFFGCSQLALGALTFKDIDNDNIKELVMSYHALTGTTKDEYTIGRTYIFDSFPDSFFHRPYYMLNLHQIEGSQNSQIFIRTSTYSYTSVIQTRTDYYERFGYFSSQYYFRNFPIQLYWADSCSSNSNWTSSHIDWVCQGSINDLSSKSDFLIRSASSYSCGSAENLALYNYKSIDSISLIWNLQITGRKMSDFIYLPQFPGYFFAFVNGVFTQFNGDDGSVYQESSIITYGEKEWAYPYDDSIPRLIVSNGAEVSFYRADIATAIYEDELETLPETFKISAPYPNPFNPEVNFSISIPRRTELNVEVFNLLGQSVGIIYSGITSAGEISLSWNAGDNPSGVYLIKVSSTEQTGTIKAVLLK